MLYYLIELNPRMLISMLRLFALCLLFLSINGFEELKNSPRQGFISEERNSSQKRYTLIWESHREKVTRYVKENPEKINIILNEASTIKLPDDVINQYRGMDRVGRLGSGLQQKVLKLPNMNIFVINATRLVSKN